jgi:hypothetical protein
VAAAIIMGVLDFDPTRPILALADYVNARSSAIVTYEDPALARAPSSPDAATPRGVLVPPSILLAMTSDTVDDPVTVLRRAASEYEQFGNPGHFEVVETGSMIHVIGFPGPVTTRSASTSALLDQEISMPAVAGSGLTFIAALVESLGGISTVGVGVVPFNVLDRHRGRWEAQQREARAVLRDFVLPIGDGLSWALLYDPLASKFTLNLQ